MRLADRNRSERHSEFEMGGSASLRDVILAHIASIVVAIDQWNPGRHAPDDETLAPLLKRLQTSVIQLTSEVGGGRRDGPSEPSAAASTSSTSSTLTIVREAFVDLYPSLFGRACSGCTSARVTYLSCLQTLVKTDPKAFHGDWPRLLGGATSEPPEPSDQGKSGLYVHLGDEAPKVRHAVAASISTLIEGPAQRAYLSMATVPGGDNKVKSFISLSEVLGRMVVANVEALQAGVARAWSSRDAEDDVACAAMVRAMTTFLVGSWGLGGGGAGAGASAGGGRMPAGLAWRCVAALLAKVDVGDVRDSPSDDVVVACLGSLASIFGANGIVSIKQGADETAANDRERMDAALDVLMRRLAIEKSTRIKLEAAAALRGALRCDGGSRGAEDDDRLLPLAPLVAETKATLAGATTAKRKENAKKKKEHSNKERLTQQLVLLFGDVGIADWELAAAASGHPSARIRAAAFASLASMCARRSDGSIGGRPDGRPDGRLDACLDACLDLAEAHADEASENESTVRSSAVKAYLEVLMAIARDKERTRSHALPPFVSSQTLDADNADDHDPSTIHLNAYRPQRVVRVVASSLNDSVLAVRINAAVLAADISATIWHSSMEHIADAWRDPTTRQRGLAMLSELLHAAVEACRDHEKVAVHGVRALGYVAGAIIRLGGRTDVLDPRADAIVSVLDSCMSRGKNGKKELAWSCAEAVTVASMLDTEQDDELIARMRAVVNP